MDTEEDMAGATAIIIATRVHRVIAIMTVGDSDAMTTNVITTNAVMVMDTKITAGGSAGRLITKYLKASDNFRGFFISDIKLQLCGGFTPCSPVKISL